MFPIHVKNRTRFAKYLRKNNIRLNINNRRNDIYPMFGRFQKNLVMTARADRDVVLLPIHADLTDKQVNYIIGKVKEASK